MSELHILELFSGIGGMHCAFEYAKVPGEVVSAMDINPNANCVYALNFPKTPVKNSNIQKLSPKDIEILGVNTILLSPPCQPHTCQGLQRDINDPRSDALKHICRILPECKNLEYLLLENVRGFEDSLAHDQFIAALKESGFFWREFILSPTLFNFPNTRYRYYCLARKRDFNFTGSTIWREMPNTKDIASNDIELLPKATIGPLLETRKDIPLIQLPDKQIEKRVWLLDIVNASSTNSMCFTKSYTHYCEGTGSVFTKLSNAEIKEVFNHLRCVDEKLKNPERYNAELLHHERTHLVLSLEIRYFTPREVLRLMKFPESFEFPPNITDRQKYRLIGNSINVLVVGELIKLLVK